MRRGRTRWCAGLAALLGAGALTAGLVAPPAYAHGAFETGSPGPGDSVAAGSTVLALEFEAVDPGSRATVELSATGPGLAGSQPVGAALVLDEAATVCAGTEPLTPGVWTVGYTLTSPDGAVADGGYAFEVLTEESAAPDAARPGACAGEELRDPMLPVASTADSPSAAPWIAAGGAATLALVLGVLVLLRRRSA